MEFAIGVNFIFKICHLIFVELLFDYGRFMSALFRKNKLLRLVYLWLDDLFLCGAYFDSWQIKAFF